MNRSGAVIAAVAVILAFAGGLGVGRFLVPSKPSGIPASEAPSAMSNAGVENPDYQRARAENAARAAPESPKGFTYTRLVLDTSGDAPKACFQFTEKLDSKGSVNYADFVRMAPSTIRPIVSVDGQSLCLSGLDFDKDYRATLRAGLPSAS
ncbi:MAG TPA: hypothetical protein VNH64_10205, partial [Parvularculaceae bacterium]|nr:hypothetical protein [Parvularculaceae bacterium]